MDDACGTRAIKILRHLQRSAPPNIPRSSLRAVASLAPEVLSTLHDAPNLDELTKNPELSRWLRANPIPRARLLVTNGLFRGTLVFVRMTYRRPNKPDFAMVAADVQTAVTYTTLAVTPIVRYASQYGIASLNVSPNVVPFLGSLSGDTFDDDVVRRFVDQIFAINNLPRETCVVILHDDSLPAAPRNTDGTGNILGYHSMTDQFHFYCFCRAFGQNLTIADTNNRYAGALSHEIAEMAVDPVADLSNPEVCDACFGNCKNQQFDLFDANGRFIGGTTNPASASGFSFFIDALIQPEFIDPDSDKSCAFPTADKQAVCIYPPPPPWNGPAGLTTLSTQIVSMAGHFSTADQRHVVVMGTQFGGVHEIFWKPAQAGIEGEDDLPVNFATEGLAAIGSLYNSDDQRHLVVAGKKNGKIEEIFWKSDTVGIEGHDELPVTFNGMVALSALYDKDQRRHLVIVGTKQGTVHELFWRSDSVGLDGVDQLPVDFYPRFHRWRRVDLQLGRAALRRCGRTE